MTREHAVRFGGEVGEHVSLRRMTRTDRENWFYAEVEVYCDGWNGKMRASFMKGELTRFADEIRNLHKTLSGEVQLKPMDGHLTLKLLGDGKGHIQVDGTAQNQPACGTQLSFRLEIDQTYLSETADALCDLDSNEQF